MTRTTGQRAAGTQRRVAALHAQGDRWRLVAVEKGSSAAARFVHAETFADADVSGVRAAMDRLGVSRLVRVLPACACVSRGIEVPDASESDLAQTLALVAEAQLPTGIAAHRRAWGVMEAPATEGHRAAMVLGWAGDAPAPIDTDRETWTSELAALAALAEPRRSSVAAYADRTSGSIALLAWNGTRASVRALREAPPPTGGAADEWNTAAESVVRQAAERFGIEAPEPAASPLSLLWLDPGARARAAKSIEALPARDDGWFSEYGVALGAACGALSASPANARLFELLPHPRAERRSPFESTVAWFAQPRRAGVIAGVAAALILLVPLAAAWATKAIYRAKAAGIEAQQQGESPDEFEVRLAVYRELEKRRVPMAKVMADVAGCMPAGVTLDSLQVVAADRRLAIRGKASERATITQFVSKLNASGVFADCDAGRTDFKDDQYEFDVSGRVASAFSEARGVEDWGATPLAVKLYGEEARKPRAVEGAAPEKKAPAPTARGGRRDIFDSRAGGAAKPADPVPAALTDDAIKALDRSAASKELAARTKARSRSDIDAATKDRLKEELDKIRARLKDIQQQGGGS